MKKMYLGLFVSTALLGFNVAHAATTLDGDTLNFKGYVLQNSCDISYTGVNGKTVYLPVTQNADFSLLDGTSNKSKAFSIKLKNCASDSDLKNYTEPDVYRKISWNVQSPQWTLKDGSLKLIKNSDNALSNVALYLKNNDGGGQVTASNYKFKASSADDDTYNFEVGYAKIVNLLAATTGGVSGSATFNIVYE